MGKTMITFEMVSCCATCGRASAEDDGLLCDAHAADPIMVRSFWRCDRWLRTGTHEALIIDVAELVID